MTAGRNRRAGWRRGWLIALVVTSWAGGIAPAARAANPGAHNDFDWLLPPASAGPIRTVYEDVKITQVGSTDYWSLGGHFAKQAAGDGWYMGIQTNGTNIQGQPVDAQAIFSIWRATTADPGPGAACGKFGGEGVGLSCRVPLPAVAVGHVYQFRVVGSLHGSWTAYVIDKTAGHRYKIGRIRPPRGENAIGSLYNFIENFGSLDCAHQSPAAAQFSDPGLSPRRHAYRGIATPQKSVDGLGACGQGALTVGSGGVGAILGSGAAPRAPRRTPPPP